MKINVLSLSIIALILITTSNYMQAAQQQKKEDIMRDNAIQMIKLAAKQLESAQPTKQSSQKESFNQASVGDTGVAWLKND